MRFPYRRYAVRPTPATKVHEIHRPVIPFRLGTAAKSAPFWAHIDTGADETFITRQMANLVGLTINDSQAYRVMAASGTIIQAHYAPATITLANENEKYQWQTIVTVVEETWPEAIFGLPGFLDYFEIRLDGHSKHLELAPNQGCPHS